MTFETVFRRLIRGGRRQWVAIIPFLVIGIVIVLPLVDQYTDSRQCHTKLRASLARLRSKVEQHEQIRKQAKEVFDDLEQSASLAIPNEDVHVFRQELVDWIRDTNCQVRRIRLGTPVAQRWEPPTDADTEVSSLPATKTHTFQLTEQLLSLSISGELASVEDLLSQLHRTKRFMRSKTLALYPARENRSEMILDLELTLLDLVEKEKP